MTAETGSGKSIFDRVSGELHYALCTSQCHHVIPLGVTPSGTVTEDYISRGDTLQRDVTLELTPWWQKLQDKKDTYHHFRSLNENVVIYAPLSLSGSVSLLEWVVFSGVVDPHTVLSELCSSNHFKFDPHFFDLRNSLNGRNVHNQQNIVIDFKNGIVIGRNNARLSINSDTNLAMSPIAKIKDNHDLYLDQYERYNSKRQRQHFDVVRAKTLAFTFLRESFFT